MHAFVNRKMILAELCQRDKVRAYVYRVGSRLQNCRPKRCRFERCALFAKYISARLRYRGSDAGSNLILTRLDALSRDVLRLV